jgi:hypothetical protein
LAATIPVDPRKRTSTGDLVPVRLRRMPAHRQRASTHEARIAGLAITLSVAALVLVLAYIVGGYAHRIVVEIVPAPPSASTR